MKIRMTEWFSDEGYLGGAKERFMSQLQIDFATNGTYDDEYFKNTLIDALRDPTLKGDIIPEEYVWFDRVDDNDYEFDFDPEDDEFEDDRYVACALIDFSHNGNYDSDQIERIIYDKIDRILDVDVLGVGFEGIEYYET